MKKITTTIAALIIAAHSFAQTTIIDSIVSNGIYRNYRLYVPAAYSSTSARPLVINMHGYTSNAQQQQLYSNFMPIADTANFLMVLPNGTFSGGSQYWNAGISPFGANDILFIDDLITHLKQSYNINLNRVYATGMSNGGFMSYTLACALSNKIAAIASVTGSIFTAQKNTCAPNRPVPVMQIHGTADATVPYGGSSGIEPIDSTVMYWVRNNQCATTPVFTAVPNTNTTDGCTAERYVYNNGNNGSTVELFKIIGGAHTWPGAPVTVGVTNQDISASKEIWRFFNKYTLSQLTAIATTQPNELLNVYPNPANSTIYITGVANNATVKIIDILGKTILTATDKTIDITSLQAGMYIINVENTTQHLKLIKE